MDDKKKLQSKHKEMRCDYGDKYKTIRDQSSLGTSPVNRIHCEDSYNT